MTDNSLSRAVFDTEAAKNASLGKLPEIAIWDSVMAQFGLDECQLTELRKDFWSGDQLDQNLLLYLKKLRPKYRTAILSNAWTNARILFTENYLLHTAVDMIILSSEERLLKPDVRIFQLSAERLGVRTDECVFVDDFMENIEGAQSAGMIGVHFTSSAQTIEDLDRILCR